MDEGAKDVWAGNPYVDVTDDESWAAFIDGAALAYKEETGKDVPSKSALAFAIGQMLGRRLSVVQGFDALKGAGKRAFEMMFGNATPKGRRGDGE